MCIEFDRRRVLLWVVVALVVHVNAAQAIVDADDIPFTPAGNVSATDVQAAVEEVDDEKQSETGIYLADDYASGSSTGGIQEAIDAANTDGGGLVMAPPGETTVDLQSGTVTSGITLKQNVTLIGHGREGTTIKCINPPTGSSLTEVGEVRCLHIAGRHTGMENLEIHLGGNNQRDENVAGVVCGDTIYVGDTDLRNVRIDGLGAGWPGYGLVIKGCLRGHIRGGSSDYWTTAMYVTGLPSTSTFAGSNAWRVSTELRFSTTGLLIETNGSPMQPSSCSQIWIDGSVIEGNDIGIDVQASCNVHVANTHFENSVTQVRLNHAAGYTSISNHYSNSASVAIERTMNQFYPGGPDVSLSDAFKTGTEIKYTAGRIQVRTPHNSPAKATGRVLGANLVNATDCTAFVGKFAGDLCWEQDDKKLWVADPSGTNGSVTDEASDWVELIDLP